MDKNMERSIMGAFVRLRAVIASLALIIVGYFRFFVLKQSSFDDILLAVSDALVISIIVFLLVQISTFFVHIPTLSTQSMELVQVGQISARSRANAQNANKWEYIGHVGRHTRTVVFKAFSERASAQGSESSIDIVLISPFSDEAIKLYCDHKRSAQIRHYDTDPVSVDDVKAEILATVLRCKSLVQDYPQLRVRLFLSNFFSAFRYDVSPDEIIMTQEDPFAPALAVKKESQLFLALQKECASIRSQSREVGLEGEHVDTLDENSSKGFFTHVFSDFPYVEDEVISMTLAKLRDDRNPYAG